MMLRVERNDVKPVILDIYIDDLHATTSKMDGIIISTSLGSVAYNRSVQGPILPGTIDSII